MQSPNERGRSLEHDRIGALESELVRLREDIRRERDAREKAEAADRFKEELFGVLGHDLRNPLNTILTTVRLLSMRNELSAEMTRRLDRVVSNGVRMQRMIEQVLDVTEGADAIPIASQPNQDIAELVSAVVDEAAATYPERDLELLADRHCHAPVDPERIDQVLRTLIGNALAHGATDRPIHVRVESRPRHAVIEVHNYGAPIDDAHRAELFAPFRRHRATTPASPPAGLGLGLYVAHRIVTAHAGLLDVDSSLETGTRFRITLPR